MYTSAKSLSSYYAGLAPLARQLATVFGVVLPCLASAQIKTDGSVGPGAQTLSGPRYQIGENLGRRAGTNVFHSFQTFNLNTGESASFTTSAPTSNVISRVTGGTPSQINGQISLNASSGAPNFYFINPAGVTFGAGASIDVPGAFHVSTANSVKFPDGSFHADPKAASTFSSMPPEAFGFLAGSRGTLTVRDKALLSAKLEQPISLSAGDIVIDNARVQTTGGGELRVAAVGGNAADVPLTGALPAMNGTLTTINGGSLMTITGNTPDVVTTVTTPGTTTVTPTPTPRGRTTPPTTPVVVTTETTTTIVQAGEARNGGNILISAGDLTTDGRGNTANLTGISSSAVAGNSGNGGNVEVTVARNLNVQNGSLIVADTYSNGNAGTVTIKAKNVIVDGKGNKMDTGIGSAAYQGTGSANTVTVNASGDISIMNGGIIAAPTMSAGNGAALTVSAGSMTIDGQGNESGAGISSGAFSGSSGKAGNVTVTVAQDLSIRNIGVIDSSTAGSGDAGNVKVSAGNITLDGQGNFASISSVSSTEKSGKSGNVQIATPGQLLVTNGGTINTSTLSFNRAGNISVVAGKVVIDGQGKSTLDTSISSGSRKSATGNAGNIDIAAFTDVNVLNGAAIASATETSGNGGSITIGATNVLVNGQDVHTAVGSSAAAGSTGNAGNVTIAASGNLIVARGAAVDSSTAGTGNAGTLKISANDIGIAGGTSGATISSGAIGTARGNAGTIDITANNNVVMLDNSFITSLTSSSGNAGVIKIRTGNLVISSNSRSAGIANTAIEGSRGSAGDIDILASGTVAVSNGVIDSSTFSRGNAGNITINAADTVALSNGALITSITQSSGAAGSIGINAKAISVDKSYISALASESSSGQAGNIKLVASDKLSVVNRGIISIQNLATVPEAITSGNRLAAGGETPSVTAANIVQGPVTTNLSITAPTVSLSNSQVTTQSMGNVAASSVDVNSGNTLSMNSSTISTSSNRGNGGAVTVNSGNNTTINRSQITTSVAGTDGNGGDININSRGLTLNGGFVQANTAARNGRGGNVGINVDTLIPSLGTLTVGGSTPMTFTPDIPGMNVIQAAAPTGVSGNIKISTPTLNISGVLMALKYQILDTGGLARNPCQVDKGSSLTQAGRGALPASSSSLQLPTAGGAAPAVTPLSGVPQSDAYSRWNCRNG